MRFTPPDGVLNLAQTLDCGQSFRFYPVTLENNIPAWRGVAFSRGLTVYQDENNDLVLDCTSRNFMTFGLIISILTQITKSPAKCFPLCTPR